MLMIMMVSLFLVGSRKNLNNKSQLGFIHTFIPSDSSRTDDDSLNLLLLHGTGGDENDLISIARMLEITNASILSPRGKVLENGMPRFFRRLAEGVFDIEDLRFRTNELADFVQKASKTYTFDLNRTIAIGYSNGANIAQVCSYFVQRFCLVLFFLDL